MAVGAIMLRVSNKGIFVSTLFICELCCLLSQSFWITSIYCATISVFAFTFSCSESCTEKTRTEDLTVENGERCYYVNMLHLPVLEGNYCPTQRLGCVVYGAAYMAWNDAWSKDFSVDVCEP